MIDRLRGNCSLDEVFERIKIKTRRLARKQRIWRRRFPNVTWFDAARDETAEAIATRIIEKVMQKDDNGR